MDVFSFKQAWRYRICRVLLSRFLLFTPSDSVGRVSGWAVACFLLDALAEVEHSVFLMSGLLQDKNFFVTECLVLWGLAGLADTNCIKAIKPKGNVMWAEFQHKDWWHFPSSFREREVSMMYMQHDGHIWGLFVSLLVCLWIFLFSLTQSPDLESSSRMENLGTLHWPAVFPTCGYFKGKCDGSCTAERHRLAKRINRIYCVKTEIILRVSPENNAV